MNFKHFNVETAEYWIERIRNCNPIDELEFIKHYNDLQELKLIKCEDCPII